MPQYKMCLIVAVNFPIAVEAPDEEEAEAQGDQILYQVLESFPVAHIIGKLTGTLDRDESFASVAEEYPPKPIEQISQEPEVEEDKVPEKLEG